MPLDESLPRFSIEPAPDRDPFKSVISLSQNFRPAEPAYIKQRSKHPDEYSVALLDAYINDIVYAQVVVKPTVSMPTLSAEEIRKQANGGSPVMPNVTVPKEFTIQMYNPESQVVVSQKSSRWTGDYWEFSLPKKSFRQPTGSKLDVEAARANTLPTSGMSRFRWRREGGVLSRGSLACALLSPASSLSHDAAARKKGGSEPDITVAILDKLKDVTIYEPHLQRVDVEDMKGLEVVLVLSAAVIADLYYSTPSSIFNVSPHAAPARRSSGGKVVTPTIVTPPTSTHNLAAGGAGKTNSPITLTKAPSPPRGSAGKLIDQSVYAETARLQREERENERRRQKQVELDAKKAEAEQRRIRKMLDDEERERRRKQAVVDAETERLKKQYKEQEAAWDQVKRSRHHSVPGPGNMNGGGGGGGFAGVPGYYGGGNFGGNSRPVPPVPYNSRPPAHPPRPQQYGANLMPGGPPVQMQPPQQLGHRRKSSSFLRILTGGSGGGDQVSPLGGAPPANLNGGGRLAKKKSSLW